MADLPNIIECCVDAPKVPEWIAEHESLARDFVQRAATARRYGEEKQAELWEAKARRQVITAEGLKEMARVL